MPNATVRANARSLPEATALKGAIYNAVAPFEVICAVETRRRFLEASLATAPNAEKYGIAIDIEACRSLLRKLANARQEAAQ